MEILHEFFKKDAFNPERKVTDEQIEEILSLQYEDETLIFDPEDSSTFIEVLALFNRMSSKKAIAYLRTVKSFQELVLESKLLEDDRMTVQIKHDLLARETPGVEEYLGKCTMCGNNKLLVQQIQTRSADEPMTNFFKCTSCKYAWRSG